LTGWRPHHPALQIRLHFPGAKGARVVRGLLAVEHGDLGDGLVPGHFAVARGFIPEGIIPGRPAKVWAIGVVSKAIAATAKAIALQAGMFFGVACDNDEIILAVLKREFGGAVEQIGLHRLAIRQRIAAERDAEAVLLNLLLLEAVPGGV